jgi:hypothetical protein
MKRGLLLMLFAATVGCRENTAPEAVTTTTAMETAPARTAAAAAPATSTGKPPLVSGPKLVPIDEGARDPEFARYRNELAGAVLRRNVEGVIALIDPNIRTSFGGEGGADAFRKLLQSEETWQNLQFVLANGGKFRGEGDQRSFWAPYVYAAWPEGYDAFQSLAVTSMRVPMHRSANANSPVIATLSYDIVTRSDVEGQVSTADGKAGFVNPKMLWSPVGFRAGFSRSGGKWRMDAWVAGD